MTGNFAEKLSLKETVSLSDIFKNAWNILLIRNLFCKFIFFVGGESINKHGQILFQSCFFSLNDLAYTIQI